MTTDSLSLKNSLLTFPFVVIGTNYHPNKEVGYKEIEEDHIKNEVEGSVNIFKLLRYHIFF